MYALLLMCTQTISNKDWFTNYRQRRKIMIYCRWNAWKESVVHQSSQREANNSGDFYLPKMRRAMRKFCPEGKRRAKINVPFNIWWKKIPSAFSPQFVPNSILIWCFISDVHFSLITKATNMQRSTDILCKKKCLFVKNLSTTSVQFPHKIDSFSLVRHQVGWL